jgi:hypothetical protein
MGMLKFEVTYRSSFCVEWPRLIIENNTKAISDITCDSTKFIFKLPVEDTNTLRFKWVNKTEKHTKVQNGLIMQDQVFEMTNIRVDDIQIESWFWTNGWYEPNYFTGFIRDHQNQRKNVPIPKKLKSQLIWHFPGVFTFPDFPLDFWDWYFIQKQGNEQIKFLDKDPERINKFRGSLDPCLDVVQKLRQYIT